MTRPLDATAAPLNVADIKQYLYCPRVIYFHHVVPVERRTTRKMEYGREGHVEFERLEARRRYRAYRLTEAERVFKMRLHAPRLGLTGVLDLALKVKAPGSAGRADASFTYIPVECKDFTGRVHLNHKYQLVAYACALEEVFRRPVPFGFIYLLRAGKAIAVDITDGQRAWVRGLVGRIRGLIAAQAMPPPTTRAGRCVDCEFRRLCGDVV
jgi:CRISPR-associated exonuclease Cas4